MKTGVKIGVNSDDDFSVLEGSVEEYGKAYAQEHGWLYRKLQWIGRKGAPDDFFSRKGDGNMLVEFKAPKKEPSVQQRREHKRLRDAGTRVEVVNTVEGVRKLFT